MNRRRIITLVAATALVGSVLGASVGIVLAVHDEGMQLEGNASASDLTYTDLDLVGSPPKSVSRSDTLSGDFAGAYDWDSLLDITGTPAPGNAEGSATAKATGDLPDGFTDADFQKDFKNSGTTFQTSDDTTFATGSKDTLDITPGWQCAHANNVNSKTDIMNGFAAVMEQGSHRFLYFGLDKAVDNGNNNVGLWMLKDPSVGCSSTSGTASFTGHHTVGDLLIVSAFTNGGGVSAITAYEWVADKGDGSPGINPLPVATSADCLDAGGSGQADNLCAVINGKSVSMPFLTANNGVINAAHPSPNFWEGGLELSAFPQFADACFNRYVLDTRSSQSLTATIFDYVQGSLNTCNPSTTLSKTASESKIHSGDSVTYTYVDTNDGNRVLSNVSVSDDKCSPVAYVSGDTDSDSKLDPGEAWHFSCTTTLTQTTTNTAVAHGSDGLNDVTYCADPQSPPANTICDQDERAQATVTVIHPATTLTKKSQSPANPVYANTSVTIVVTETNTGDDTLTNVFVDGTGCTTWAPVGSFSGTLAPNAAQDFSCTYTPGASGGWTADGHGTDSLNSAAPSTNEHQSGSVVVINPATTLTKKSQLPANPVYANTSVTIVVTEKNAGDTTLTGVNITGTGCTTWAPVGSFSGTLAAGAEQDFSCTYTPGVSGSWSADGHGKDVNNNDVPATNEHTSGSVVVITPSTVLTKTASVNATITYTYTEKNDGDVDLTTPSISDDKCSSVVGVDVNNDTFNDGDTNKDGMLSAGANGAGETWLFKCTVTVNNVTSDYSSTNVATGHAFDPNNVDITPPLDPDETDTTTVTIHIQ